MSERERERVIYIYGMMVVLRVACRHSVSYNSCKQILREIEHNILISFDSQCHNNNKKENSFWEFLNSFFFFLTMSPAKCVWYLSRVSKSILFFLLFCLREKSFSNLIRIFHSQNFFYMSIKVIQFFHGIQFALKLIKSIQVIMKSLMHFAFIKFTL